MAKAFYFYGRRKQNEHKKSTLVRKRYQYQEIRVQDIISQRK